jgi:hypothetical protein
MDTQMNLRYDPYQIFRLSKTPAGLYARQKWLGKAGEPQWNNDFQETVTALWADQLTDGSWQHATVPTIKHLFDLHLTVRSTAAQIDAALAWLLDKVKLQNDKIYVSSEDVATEIDLTGLPFIPSRPDMLLTGATLFLASIFGHESDPDVLTIYEWLSTKGIMNKGRWFDGASSHNIFRAMVVHPEFAKDRATALAVQHLADLQTDSGDWGEELTFYQITNALAHLELPQAQKQIEKAFERLFETQNSDGTWSRSEPEWNTFLAIHALRNKGLL